MSKHVCLLIFFLALLFIFPLNTHAVSVVINDPPTTIGSDTFSLSVTVVGASAGTNYLRVDLYKDETTSYFGQTFNGSEWYSGSNGIQYFPVTVPSDTPFVIQARIGDTIPNSYDGTGNYKLRIRRYTSSGNYNNDEAKASAVPVTLVFPTVTPVPTNLPTPTKTPTPTKNPTPTHSTSSGQAKIPTATKTISEIKTPTIFPTKATVLAARVSPTDVASDSSYPTPVLGVQISASPTSKTSDKKVLVKESSNSSHVAAGFLIGGGLFLAACAILVYRRIKHGKDTYNE